MVGLIIEAPLAENNIGTAVFDLLNHVCEALLLVRIELFVFCNAANVDGVFGLWFGWLECAGQNGQLGILKRFGHLRMAHSFVKNDAYMVSM
jgi:hypothetical protein